MTNSEFSPGFLGMVLLLLSGFCLRMILFDLHPPAAAGFAKA